MENVLLVGCDNCMIDNCVACYPCIKAFNKKEGEFAGLPADAKLVGLVSCGGCPGTTTIVARLNQFNKWVAATDPQDMPTKIFVGNCIQGCPQSAAITKKIEDASAATVTQVKGTHHNTPAGKDPSWWPKANGDLHKEHVLFK